MKICSLCVCASFVALSFAGQLQAAAPAIQPLPKKLSVNAGSTAAFSISVSNALSYQWQFKGTNVADATNSDFSIENVSAAQAGAYRVLISTASGSVTSQTSSLIVIQGTIVRFALSSGNVDVELFDHDKPASVQNFIHYVKAGIYANAFFERLVPNYVLQGGGEGTLDRGTNLFTPANCTNLLTWANSLQTFSWYINNEFSLGPRVRNTFGTLAMARVPGETNSANSQWFFNLADNSTNLDYQDGGFTVFGRVIAGTNVLESFNALSTNNGIIDLTSYWPTNGGSNFNTMPILSGTNYPSNADLFYTSISFLTKPVIDSTQPKIAITYPAPNASLTNENFTLRGTASDNSSVAMVACAVNYKIPFFGMWFPQHLLTQVLQGTTNWSLPLNLFPGYFTVTVESWDGHGNTKWISRAFTVTTPLTLQSQGPGKISSALNGKYLNVYQQYSVTATPDPGQMLASWSTTNGTISINPKLTFTMQPNLTLLATFVTNNFPAALGTYNGLFYQSNAVSPDSSGFFTLTTSGKIGAFSGKLFMAGKSTNFSGQFDYTGSSQISTKQPGTTNSIVLSLNLDLTNQTGEISGVVSNASWRSTLLGYRGVTKLTASTIPKAGRFVLALPMDLSETNQPQGYATIIASATGALTYNGVLGDNESFTRSVTVSKEGLWPLYASLYGGKGVVIGWETFTNTSCAGQLGWIRPPGIGGYYTNGFSIGIDSLGEAYAFPVRKSQYQLTFSGATFVQPVTYNLSVGATGQFSAPGVTAANFKMAFTPSTGAFSGQFVKDGKTLMFKGTFQDPAKGGSGFFIDQNGQTGLCQLSPL